MKVRFDRAYLFSAEVILAVTGLGKVLTVSVVMLCVEKPMLGIHQPGGWSNRGVTGLAAGIELANVALICFSPVRWLPCLASASWGALCLVVRLLYLDGEAHCNCLGWGDASPLAAEVIAAYLAVGGGFAFWKTLRSSLQLTQPPIEQRMAARSSQTFLLWSLAGICLFWGLRTLFDAKNYGEGDFGALFLITASPAVAIGFIALLRGFTSFRCQSPGAVDARH